MPVGRCLYDGFQASYALFYLLFSEPALGFICFGALLSAKVSWSGRYTLVVSDSLGPLLFLVGNAGSV